MHPQVQNTAEALLVTRTGKEVVTLDRGGAERQKVTESYGRKKSTGSEKQQDDEWYARKLSRRAGNL
jgi:hypothetical protein